MRTPLALLAVAATLGLTGREVPGQARTSSRPVQVVVSGGLQVPTGEFADYHDLGVHADVSVSLSVGGLRFRPELSYSRFGLKDLGSLLGSALGAHASVLGSVAGASRAAGADDALSTLLGGFANLELPLGSGRVQPFLLAGVGAMNLSTDATSSATSISKVKASVNLGAGLRFRLGGIGGLIEARLNNVPAGEAGAYFKDVRTIPVTFGLVF